MGTRYGPIEYREKDHYDIDQKLLSVDHCESMSYFGDFNHNNVEHFFVCFFFIFRYRVYCHSE